MAAAQLPKGRLCGICGKLDMKTFVYVTLKRKTSLEEQYDNIPDDLDLNSDQVYRHHTSLGQLRASSSHCELCAEIWRIFWQNTGVPLEELTPEILESGLSGTQLYLVLLVLRATRLVVFQRDLEHDTGRLVASLQMGIHQGQDSLRVKHSWIPGLEQPYSPCWAISPYSGSEECFIFAKWALDKCTTTHTRCKQAKAQLQAPSRLIDIRDRPRIVTTAVEQKAKYAALSYCWGGDTSAAMLTTATQEYFSEAIPETTIPAIVADAITTSRKLGLHFIWVDALCILQDSSSDLLQELSKMRDIYRGAFVTIHGSSAGKTSDRLFTHRNIHHIRFPWSTDFNDKAYIYLYEDADSTTSSLDYAPVNSRAWCFQESTLATRSLWIGQQQTFFECAEVFLDERGMEWKDSIGLEKRLIFAVSQFEKHWIKSWRLRAWGIPPIVFIPIPLPKLWWNYAKSRYRVSLWQYSIRLGMVQISTRLGKWYISRTLGIRFINWNKDTSSVYDTWRWIVQQYSRRQLSYPKDTFSALSGLADAYHRATGEDYIAGMWNGDLIRSLTWESPRMLPTDEEEVKKLVEEHRKIGYLAPSWSWASVGLNKAIRFPKRPQLSWQLHPAVSVLSFWTTPVNALQPFGEIEDAELVLRGPLLRIPNPRLPPDPTSAAPLLHEWLHTKLNFEFPIALSEAMPRLGKSDLEYAFKHEDHAGQEFALLKICIERELNLSEEKTNKLTAPATFLIIETCVRNGRSTDANLQYWRRVGILSLPTEIGSKSRKPSLETPGGHVFFNKAQEVIREFQNSTWANEIVHLV